MNRTLRIALIGGATFLVILLYGLGDTADPSTMALTGPYADDPYASYSDESTRLGDPQAAPRNASGQGQRVTIVDRGLQMPRGTQVVPAGWRLTQDLATDPNTARPVRTTLDLYGPRGEIVRSLGLAQYGQMMGTSFQQSWRQHVMQRFEGGLTDVSLGDLRRSEVLEGSRPFQQTAQKASGQGMRMEGLEAPLRARRAGQPVEGVVYIAHFVMDQFQAGLFQAAVVLSSPEHLEEAIRTNLAFQNSYEPNPAFEQRLEQLNQRVMQQQAAESRQRMAQSQAQHKQRMAANRAQFDAYQQVYRANQDAADMQMQSWQARQNSNDEMHRRTINSINETVDLYNNQTGETYYGAQSGYDSYWTDPTGNVVGTQGYDNPDVMRYNQATDLDDMYRQGGTGWGGNDGPDGW